MQKTSPFAWAMLTATAALAQFTGCASIPAVKPPVEDIAEKSKPRQDEVLSNFERRRDAAQLQAAADRLKQGDAGTAEMMLKKLLERNADYAPAKLLLARVLIDRQDYAGAEQHLRQIIEKFPKEAAAHYELAMLLDDLGRAPEAISAFAKATELEPSNELYRLSYQALSPAVANRRPSTVTQR